MHEADTAGGGQDQSLAGKGISGVSMEPKGVRVKRGFKGRPQGRGDGAARVYDYQELIERFRRSGHYTGYGEPGARNGNKPRLGADEAGKPKLKETARRPTREDPPLPGYDELSLQLLLRRLDSLSRNQLVAVRAYEETHGNRRALMDEIDRRLRVNSDKSSTRSYLGPG
jgi:hypothetical protein